MFRIHLFAALVESHKHPTRLAGFFETEVLWCDQTGLNRKGNLITFVLTPGLKQVITFAERLIKMTNASFIFQTHGIRFSNVSHVFVLVLYELKRCSSLLTLFLILGTLGQQPLRLSVGQRQSPR